jgi:hypothetical protein
MKKVHKLFNSVVTLGNRIYLLHIDHDDQYAPFCTNVVKFLFSNKNFTINNVYSLSNNRHVWLEIALTKDEQIVASCASMHVDPFLNVYQLKEQ